METPRPLRNRPFLVVKSSRVNRRWKKVWKHEILRNMFARVLKFHYAYMRCVFMNPWRLEDQEDESSEKEFPTRNSPRKAKKLKQENSEFVLSFRKPEGTIEEEIFTLSTLKSSVVLKTDSCQKIRILTLKIGIFPILALYASKETLSG